jgi:hypothetical protein
VVKMNKKSEIILKQKMEKQKANIDDGGEDFDLWPVMQKNYFEK